MTLFSHLSFADVADTGTVTTAAEEGLTKSPVDLYNFFGFEITNSIISETIVTLIIIAVIQFSMRKPKLVPTGMQNFVEWIVEAMSNFLELLLGRETTARGFWYFGGLLVFIALGNLLALIPGVGTFGLGHDVNGHFEVTKPFLRGMNANDNLTAAYSAIFFFMFFYWCIRSDRLRRLPDAHLWAEGSLQERRRGLDLHPDFLPRRLGRGRHDSLYPPDRLHLPSLRQHLRRRIPARLDVQALAALCVSHFDAVLLL